MRWPGLSDASKNSSSVPALRTPNATWQVARVSAENAQLREQLAGHQESLHIARERLDVQGADIPALEDQLFARADRIAALEKELATVVAAHAEKSGLLDKSEQRS
jgi:hypothetical protein